MSLPLSPVPPRQTSARGAAFLQTLSQANRSRERWDKGWRIESIDEYNDRLSVTKGDRQRVPLAGEFLNPIDGRPPQVGDEIYLRAGYEEVDEPNSRYVAYGERLGDGLEDALTVHFSFHVPATHAAELVASVTDTLNQALVPFRLECLADPDRYGRPDAAVLCVSRRFFTTTVHLLQLHLSDQLRRALVPEVPPLTEALLPGRNGLTEESENAPYLQAVSHLGRRLCRDAIWHQGRCNWLGWLPQPKGSGPTYGALGPDLANGTAGIAIFLAELWRLTGEPQLRTTAEGAIQQALHSLDHRSSLDRDEPSLKDDDPGAGIAWSLLRLGQILDHEPWIERGRHDLQTTSRPPARPATQRQAPNPETPNPDTPDQETPDQMPWVDAAAQALDQHLHDDQPWPCGVPDGAETPGLQFGLAGIGYAFLRRLDPHSVPAVPVG